MRYVLLVLALCACHRAPTSTTPANQAPSADYRATADDELGFLPVGSDLVLGVNMTAARQSALWHTFEAQIAALGKEFEKISGQCGPNPINTVERFQMALTMNPDKTMHGVVVIRGVDTTKALDCVVTQSKKAGGNASVDRGVAVVSYPNKPVAMAVAVVGPSTVVMQLDKTVSYDTMQKVLASGAPLRTSPTFLTLYQRREPNASVWGMANGSAAMFNELAQQGVRPRSIDGTVVLTDKIALAVRLVMETPDAAAKVNSEIAKVKPMAGAYVETLDANANESTVAIRVVMNETQLRQIMGMLGGAFGP
jgi:hypothetical protein